MKAMKVFSIIFAVMLVLGTSASLRSEDTPGQVYKMTLSQDSLTDPDSCDTLTLDAIPNDMGLVQFWVELDSVTDSVSQSHALHLLAADSLYIYWRVQNRGNHWRPLYIDSSSVDGAAPTYITTAPAAGISMAHGKEKLAVLYDPSNPMPIPFLQDEDSEAEHIQIRALRVDSLGWASILTLRLRYERAR